MDQCESWCTVNATATASGTCPVHNLRHDSNCDTLKNVWLCGAFGAFVACMVMVSFYYSFFKEGEKALKKEAEERSALAETPYNWVPPTASDEDYLELGRDVALLLEAKHQDWKQYKHLFLANLDCIFPDLSTRSREERMRDVWWFWRKARLMEKQWQEYEHSHHIFADHHDEDALATPAGRLRRASLAANSSYTMK